MKKLTWALLSLMLFLGMGTAFAADGDGEGGGVTVTLNPADGATVIDGMSVTVTANVAAGYTLNGGINYGLAATKAEAEALKLYNLEEYTESQKPVITAGKTVLKVHVVVDNEETHKSETVEIYAEYTIAVGDIPNPVIRTMSENIQEGNKITHDVLISIRPGEGSGDNTVCWYTTDGSMPAKDGATSTEFKQAFEIGSVLAEGEEEGEVTIKAIAVDADGKTSAVVMVTYTVAKPEPADVEFMTMNGDPLMGRYGKYVEIMPMVMVGHKPLSQYYLFYTIDGETDPDPDAYYEQEPLEAGPIYLIQYDEDDYDAEMPSIMFTENTTVFKATVQSEAGLQHIEKTLSAIEIDDLEIKIENGVVKIENASYFDEDIYYTTDGTVPSYMLGGSGDAEKYDDKDGIACVAGKTIKIIGYYEDAYGVGGSDMIIVPAAPAIEPATGAVDFGSELTLTCATEGVVILYTFDGSEPSWENDNAGYYDDMAKPKITASATATSVTVKAVALWNGIPSVAAEATYTFNPITATLSLVPVKDDTVGMNVGTGIEFSIDGWEEYDGVAVYYTTDGTTVPSKAAYEAQGADGAIKMLTVETKEYEYDGETYTEVLKTDGHALAITFKEATQLKAIGYITAAGQNVTTELLDETLQIKSEAKPAFSLADGTEVAAGEKFVIENPNPYPEAPEMPEWTEDCLTNEEAAAAYEAAWTAYQKEMDEYDAAIADIPATIMYYSFDGTEPTSAAYYSQPEDAKTVFRTEEGQNVTVSVRIDKDGYYLYVPEILGRYNASPFDTVRLKGDAFTLKAMAVTTESEEGGEGDEGDYPMPGLSAKMNPGGDFAFMYGSDFASAAYKVGIAKPAFNPAGGEVSFGTKVEISCISDDAKIYYYCYVGDEEPEAIEYKEAIEITQSMKINAVAVLGDFKSEVAEATYTVIAKPTFNPAAGEVEKGTKVELSCATKDAKIYYTVDGSEPTAESAEYTTAIEINAAMTVKAIAIKGEAKSEVAEAAYKIKTANEGEELAGVSVYPNPSNGLFNIELPVSATIEVFMSNGMLYQRVKAAAGNATLNIERSGIYFLRITGEGRTTIKRVIVR